MSKHLNIVCLTVPYPVDYGGVFDLFYKLPALQEFGVSIHLHCFSYGRPPQKMLNQYCASVQYYPRQSFLKSFRSGLPYIVASRSNQELQTNLLSNDYPILMEGIHCTFPLTQKAFEGRAMFTRLHNIESDYYKDLAINTQGMWKRIHYKAESALLHTYQQQVAGKGSWLAVSPKDEQDFRQRYGCRQISYLPLFVPQWEVTGREGLGSDCLYQGALSVASNAKMASLLASEVFSKVAYKLVVAGKEPSAALSKQLGAFKNVRLVQNPSGQEMEELIANAQVNILPSLSATGIKLKLINALYNGRHCLVNNETVQGTGLESLCHVSTLAKMPSMLNELMQLPFAAEEVGRRRLLLSRIFNNQINAQHLVSQLWPV